MPRFKAWDSCPLIPGRAYASPEGTRLQFRGQVHSRYDGYHLVTFLDLDLKVERALQVDSLDALAAYRLLVPEMPPQAGWRLRRRLKRLLSPSAAERAEAVHEIAALGEDAAPALAWLQESAHFDDIAIEDALGRRTNPRAQARHALDALARVPAMREAIERLPPLVDIGARAPVPREPPPRLP
ncbi:MAG: hypothetical protein ABIQ33_12935 [Caldimonas sp.]